MGSIHASTSSVIVGALACQRDSYLRNLETEVVSCVKRESRNVVPKSKKSKAGTKPAEPEDLWLVEFADSVLFPEGGGQPSDHGVLELLSAAPESIPIQFVERQGLKCVAHCPRPLSPGDKVRQVVDSQRRWHHMQQHTGQHLLSAIMDTFDNLKTLGWGMGRVGDMNYVDLPRKPTPDEMKAIQDRCNKAIQDNLSIQVETPEDAKNDKLPDDYDRSQGVIRVISIGDIDRNPCCGTHLSQTSHISLILLHNTQTVHGTNCRLFFSAGDQAVQFATASVAAVSSAARVLGCANDSDEVVSEATRLSESVAEMKRKDKKYLSEIAQYEGDRVRARLQDGKSAWVYRADGGLDFLNKVLVEVKEVATGSKGVAIVLASGEEKKAGPLVVFGDKAAVEEKVSKIKEIVKEVKGGGGGQKWQGKVSSWQRDELEALRRLAEG